MEFEGRARIRSHLDIAPLIDVVFLLLVFFMLTSNFMTPEAVELNLPESGSAVSHEQTPIIVTLAQGGEITLNGEALELAALGLRLETRPDIGEQSITLKSDAGVEVQQLIQVMDQIRGAGGVNIALATAPQR